MVWVNAVDLQSPLSHFRAKKSKSDVERSVRFDYSDIDYDRLESTASLFRPRLLIAGASAYPREWNYERMRKIADKHSAYLLCDI